ncbi:hypothetical protein KEM48_008250 [Puccinia striiformis f. sp. tritici PST-130]|nr:hypothetical protein KEM48_008250 [Puccinia striiformis f. sp. tritici PST-130]
MDEFKAAQLAITQAQDSKIGEMQSDMREMKEMFKMFLNQAKAPENIPIPATPEPRPSARFATSTPFTSRTPGLDTTIRGNYTSQIFLPVEKTKVMLDVKKLNFHFKGTEVETFIRRVEKLANLQGAAGPDVASQLPFLVSDQKISQHIEDMEGHETGNWDLLKKQLIRKWGRATPLRRFNKDSIPTLIRILAYLTKMGYNDVNAGSGEPLWKAISAEMRKDVAKELAHDKKFKKTKDGIALIPNLEPLKEYVEAALLVLDLEEGLSKTPSVSKKPETKKEVKTQPKEEEATGKVSELEEEIKKLRTVLNTNQNARHFRHTCNQIFDLRIMDRQEWDHLLFRALSLNATILPEDIANKLVIRSGPNYYYPNREPIPRDTGTSVMENRRRISEEARKDCAKGSREEQRKEPEKEAEDELVLVRPVEKSKVGGGLKKKIFKQSFTLTLEELLLIAPNFLQELQDLAEDDAKPLSRSQNSGRCDHRDFDGELHNNHGSGALGSIKRSLTYACPLGFVYITMGSTKVKALVDTGAEMNIMPESLAIQLQLPLREISMNIMGIGGHSTPIVGLAEGINFSINTEDEKAANFFIARGKVYTVLGRPFLADHKVRLELSKSQGEILSYELWDGERLCIPICSPKVPGWEMGPPRRIEERCFSIQAENYELASRNVASFSRSSTSIINNIKASADSNLKTLDDDLDTMDNDSRTVDSDSRTTDNDSRTMDSDLGTVDNDSGVADSNLGTMDNDLNTSDDDSGVAESDLGTTDNDLNTSDDDSGVADSELGTTDNDLRTTVSELGTSDDTSSTVNNDSWNFDNSRNLTEGSKDLAHCGPGKEERNFLSLSVEDQDDYLFQNIWENWEIEQEELNSMRTHWTYSDNFDKNQLDPWASCNQPLISENSQELCKEFPGFLTGRDDFMVFLDWSGTKSYLGNLSIWPDEDCLSDQVKVALYEWGSDGRYYMNKDTYHIAIVTGEYGKEDGFLDKVVERMKLLCGKFDWELFKYVLEEDQEKWETQHQNILSGASIALMFNS